MSTKRRSNFIFGTPPVALRDSRPFTPLTTRVSTASSLHTTLLRETHSLQSRTGYMKLKNTLATTYRGYWSVTSAISILRGLCPKKKARRWLITTTCAFWKLQLATARTLSKPSLLWQERLCRGYQSQSKTQIQRGMLGSQLRNWVQLRQSKTKRQLASDEYSLLAVST